MSPTYTQHRSLPAVQHDSFHDLYKTSSQRPRDSQSGRMFSGVAQESSGKDDWKYSQPEASASIQAQYHASPAITAPEVAQPRRTMGPRMKSAEQLPPLSSIFQSSQIPFSSYSSSGTNVSPTNGPHSPRTVHGTSVARFQQQYWDSSPYPRPHSQPSEQFAYSHPSQHSTSELPPPPPYLSQSKPNSPGFYDPTSSEPRENLRERHQPTPGHWTPTDQPYGDSCPPAAREAASSYANPDRNSMPHGNNSITPIASVPESAKRQHHSEMPILLSSGRNEQQTSSAKAQKPAPAKDTLGPKIWTGTHFLPRFVRGAEVPGEGRCYFYDDGSYCRTIIDDEPVNAHWGVTKAGKPRKRLAIACITCREKKIKCDPDYPRCVQCEKFGRVCRFKNAPRGGQGSPEASSADADEANPHPVSDAAEFDASKVDRTDHPYPSLTSVQQTPRAELEENNDLKRRRSGYVGYTAVSDSKRESFHADLQSTSRSQYSPILHPQSFNWVVRNANATKNPFDTDRGFALELLDLYFAHISGTTYCFLPEHHFRRWVSDASIRKSADDLVVIYAVLAMATTFSTRDDFKTRGAEFAAICRYTANGREPSVQLVHVRLLLALYYYAINTYSEPWDYSGGALRAALGLGFNLEMTESEVDSAPSIYGLNRHGFVECRRRTFWSCYLMDHFTGFCNNSLSTIDPKDIFLRVPAKTKHFQSQADVETPFFNSSGIPIPSVLENAGVMAYLVNICYIWGEVRQNIYRSSQPHGAVNPEPFSVFYENISMRLDAWKASLPECLKFTAANLDNKLNRGISGSFATMHAIFHSTHLKLNRHLKQDTVSRSQLQKSVYLSYEHATTMLQLAETVASRVNRMPNSPEASRPFSSLYSGFAFQVAFDTVTARGKLADIPALRQRLEGAKRIVDELAQFWYCGRQQQWKMAARLELLAYLEKEGSWNTANGGRASHFLDQVAVNTELGIYEVKHAIDETAKNTDDCIYKVGWDLYSKSLEEGRWSKDEEVALRQRGVI